MRMAVSASLLALGLAACGSGGPAGKVKSACLQNGNADAEVCTCLAEASAEQLDPDQLEVLIAAFEADDDGSAIFDRAGELGAAKAISFVTTMRGIVTECGMPG